MTQMKTITDVLSTCAAGAFAACGYDGDLGVVTPSDRTDLCQFQCNGAFGGAKRFKKAPLVIAREVAAVLERDERFAKIEVAPPGFINMTLSDSYLLAVAQEMGQDAYTGVPQVEVPQTVILDYGGPNVAKPLHIGHLRSAVIGESLKRLARAAGCRVIGDVHLGDWGLQIGLVIAELQERQPELRCFAADFDPETERVPALDAEQLCDIYPFASKKSKEDEVFRKKAQQATFDLQNGRKGYLALWQEILRVSVADLKRNYNRLHVDFDLWYGESDADRYVPRLMDTLTEKGLVRESEGALVVDIEEESDTSPMPPVIVRKSDHSSLYATTDLATIIQRQADFAPQQMWYVVDKRQSLHFTQVFRCAKKAGLVPDETVMDFLGFGTMNGSDGKPYKTRDGGVMRLSDLLDTVKGEALKKLDNSEYLRSLSPEEREEVAEQVGVAAIKFGDLINHRSKDYIFDLDKFLSFEGKTGTYLLYTITRMHSILKRTGTGREFVGGIAAVYGDAERDLLLKLILTGDAFQHAFAEKAPNYIAENAYQIASAFSKFYHDSHVADEPDAVKKASWLGLITLTRKVLLLHLEVLGIEAVENM